MRPCSATATRVPADTARRKPSSLAGCVRRRGTSYRGRVGVYQVLELTEEVRGIDPREGVRGRRKRRGPRSRGCEWCARTACEKVRRG